MKRLEITVSSKDKTGKWRYTKVGSAFEREDGTWSLAIDPGVSVSTGPGVFVGLREPFKRQHADNDNADTTGGSDLPF